MKNLTFKLAMAFVLVSSFTLSSLAQDALEVKAQTVVPFMSNATSGIPNTATAPVEWSEDSQKAIAETKGKYGEPDETTATRMIWHNKGPWKQIIVYAVALPHDFPMPHVDVMESVLYYKVPTSKFDDIARFDGSISLNRTMGTMTATCNSEANNFLACNLAHDVIKNVRTPEQARSFFAKTHMDSMAGKVSPYMKKIGFGKMTNTADSDVEAKMPGHVGMKMKKEKAKIK